MKLKYVQEYKDRMGRIRRYVRLKGRPLIPLGAKPGSVKFMQEYYDAIKDHDPNSEALARATRLDSKGVVYFMDDGKFLKIGFTVDLKRRLSDYRTHSTGFELVTVIPGTRRDELELHRKFKHLKFRGEWFRKTPELESFVRKTKSERGVSNAVL